MHDTTLYFYAAFCFSMSVVGYTLGIMVFRRSPKSEAHRLYLAATASAATWTLGLGLHALLSFTPELGIFWSRFTHVGAIMIPIFYLHFIGVWLGLRISRRLILSFYLLAGCFQIICWVPGLFFAGSKTISVLHYYPQAGSLYFLYILFFGVCLIIPEWQMFKELQQAEGIRRNQIKFHLVGVVIATLGGPANFLPSYGINVFPMGTFFIAFYFGLVSYAIIRYRLMDITIIIRKTLVYSLVTGILTAIYLSIVTVFTRFFQGLTGYQTIFSSALGAALVTVGFQPLRKRIQAFVDRKFFRQYVDREEKLYELSREVITHTTPVAMGNALMRVLGETLHPKMAALYLRSRSGNGFFQVAFQGDGEVAVIMPEDNALASYFSDHPQPFVQEVPASIGESQDTRRPPGRAKDTV